MASLVDNCPVGVQAFSLVLQGALTCQTCLLRLELVTRALPFVDLVTEEAGLHLRLVAIVDKVIVADQLSLNIELVIHVSRYLLFSCIALHETRIVRLVIPGCALGWPGAGTVRAHH